MFDNFPPDHVIAAAKSHGPISMPPPLQLAPLEQLLANVRRWAPIILAACQDEEQEAGERLLMERHVRWTHHNMDQYSHLLGTRL